MFDAEKVTEGYDSHVSKDGTEYIVFDPMAVLPCYVIHINNYVEDYEIKNHIKERHRQFIQTQVDEYEELESDKLSLQSDFSSLSVEHNSLELQHNALFSNYQSVTDDYNDLVEDYNELSDSNDQLDLVLRIKLEELQYLEFFELSFY